MSLRTCLVVALLFAMMARAHAQPGATEPYPQPQPAQPYPQPQQPYSQPQPQPAQPYLQPPAPCSSCELPVYSSYPPPTMITQEEHQLLLRGEMPTGQYVSGGVVSAVVGFGIGHTVQGRWLERGWVFTAGESASLLIAFTGAVATIGCGGHSDSTTGERCDTSVGLLIGGYLAFVGFRIWEIADSFAVPPIRNARVRSLKRRLGISTPNALAPYVAPHGDGAMAGLGMRF